MLRKAGLGRSLMGGSSSSSDEEPFLFFVHDTQDDRRNLTRAREDVSRRLGDAPHEHTSVHPMAIRAERWGLLEVEKGRL